MTNAAYAKGYCGEPSLISALNNSAASFVNGLCTETDLRSLCRTSFKCNTNVCESSVSDGIVNASLVNATLLLSRNSAQQSIIQCAENAACSEHTAAAAVVSYLDNHAAAADLASVLTTLHKCKVLVPLLQNIKPVLCDKVEPAYRSISIDTGIVTIFLFLAIFVYIYGAKRFTKMNQEDGLYANGDIARGQIVNREVNQVDQPLVGVVTVPEYGSGTPNEGCKPAPEYV